MSLAYLTGAASALGLLVAIPHELTHWAVARAGTDDAEIAVEVLGGRAVTGWTPLANPVHQAFAAVAPTLCGSMLALLWLVFDVPVDGWRLMLLIGLAGYTIPSPGDLRAVTDRPGDFDHDHETTPQKRPEA